MSNRISSNANIGLNNIFGEGTVIKDAVKIGENNYFGDYVIIDGNTEIGSGNYIYNHVAIGGLPQHSRTKYEIRKSERQKIQGKILIGNNNVIREFTTVHLPTLLQTKISDYCYIMAHNHIAHDVLVEDNVIMANSCDTGGHVRLLKGANLGKAVQVHPRTVIGQYCMIGIGTVVVKNILPGVTVVGNPAQYLHINSAGLERNSFDKEQIREIEQISAMGKISSENLESFSPIVVNIYRHFYNNLAYARRLETIPPLILALLDEPKQDL